VECVTYPGFRNMKATNIEPVKISVSFAFTSSLFPSSPSRRDRHERIRLFWGLCFKMLVGEAQNKNRSLISPGTHCALNAVKLLTVFLVAQPCDTPTTDTERNEPTSSFACRAVKPHSNSSSSIFTCARVQGKCPFHCVLARGVW
jgi:hypothetical protein